MTQITGPYGRDLFVFEGEKDVVLRWGEMQEKEARMPRWAAEKLAQALTCAAPTA